MYLVKTIVVGVLIFIKLFVYGNALLSIFIRSNSKNSTFLSVKNCLGRIYTLLDTIIAYFILERLSLFTARRAASPPHT